MRPHEIAEQVVAASLADGTVAIVTGTASVNTRWARNALTTNGHSDTLDVTAITVDRSGSGARVASLTLPAAGLDPAALSAAALAAARRSAPAWDAQPLVAPGSSSPRHWQDPPAQVLG